MASPTIGRRRRQPEHDRIATQALALSTAYLALAFGWRSWLQWRRTGDTGFRLSRNDPAAARAASLLITSGAVLGFVGALHARPLPRRTSAPRRAGLALMAAATTVTLRAQLDMGRSWRVGVDERERTDLVTNRLFGVSRNPIFASMGAFSMGAVMAVPTPLTMLGAAAMVSGIELQVRHVEEPYLLREHGDAYARYMRRVGRFVPGLGRHTPAP